MYSKIISSGRNFTSIQNFNIQQQTLLRLKDFQLLPLIFSCLMFHKRINAAYPEKKEKMVLSTQIEENLAKLANNYYIKFESQ